MTEITGFRLSPQQNHARKTPGFVALEWKLALQINPEQIAQRLLQLSQEEELLRTHITVPPGMSAPVQVIGKQHRVHLSHNETIFFTSEAPVLHLQIEQQTDSSLVRAQALVTHFDLSSLRLLVSWLFSNEPNSERLQYADYAEWKWTLTEQTQGVDYWQKVHERAQGMGHLHLEQYAPVAFDGLSNECGHRCLPVLEQNLHVLAHRYATEPVVLLCAAWGALLGRLSGQQEVSLAMIDSGRGEGLEHGLGVYEQSLPIILDFDHKLPVSTILQAAAITCRRALDWRDYYTGETNCAYAFNYDIPALPQKFEEISSSNVFPRYRLKLEIKDFGNSQISQLVFDKNYYSEVAIDCIAEQWNLLLQSLVNESDRHFAARSLLGPLQQRLLNIDCQPVAIEQVSVVELIARQVSLRPDSVAVVDAQGPLSYQQIDQLANCLADNLQKNGVGPGVHVAILLPRCRDAVVAILAVLKAGGAYVPLDIAYPAERLDYMLADSGSIHVITDNQHQQQVAQLKNIYRVEDIVQSAATRPGPVPITSQTPAYLIYTSGSTGQPKAVVISHGALSTSTQIRAEYYQKSVEAYLLLSSFSFDSSVAGIFWTLTQGGQLVLPAPGGELDIQYLGKLIEQHRITHGLSLPALYQALLAELPAQRLASLHTWIVAGESCPDSLPLAQAEKIPNTRLFNEYGPTETTVWASVELLQPNRQVSIGKPIPNVLLWLINAQGEPVGIGEIGEIVLGGPTLALGYHGKTDATEQAFAPLPAVGEDRVYSSGDLAYRDTHGRLIFMGRKDHQVKIRGFRIELGEIERCLRSHPDVLDAVIKVQEHEAGRRLLAYITARHGYSPANEAMRNYLSERLPAHMLPFAVITLDEFPRMPNGKLDSHALPDPDKARRKPFVAPRTPTEIALADIIASTLRIPAVSMDDNFLEIGGDSILSLQVIARAREQGIAITVRQIFDLQTVAALADVAGVINLNTITTPFNETALATAPFWPDVDDDSLAALVEELSEPTYPNQH